ncbi:S-layer homology domain-containing protein [Paenibacillus humicus]|uniref:S-layer homology domain-containing protein n=1 Tax=Paenibacillus humicus TaxID=412861 RepID=UPI000FD8A8B0|nr:S-layer homology domain-containing protein [Paenibacillus humicus]
MKKWGSLLLILSILFTSVPTAFAAVRTDWDLRAPRGIATDSSGKLYVADLSNHRIQIYNRDESLYMTLGVKGVLGSDNDHFNTPKAVAVDQTTGDIYVLDYSNARIQVFGSQGAYIRSIALPSGNPVPEAIALDGRGHIFVTDQNYLVYRFNTNGTGYKLIANSPQLADRPMGIAADSKGNLYITQYWTSTVVVYAYNSAADTYAPQKTIGEKNVSGTDNAHFNKPWGVSIDRNDRMYVSDGGNKRVQVYNSNGSYAMTLADANLVEPSQATSDSDGNVYVVDGNKSQLLLFNAQGNFVKILGQNTAPTFEGSQAALTVAQNASPADIKTLLRVNDSDTGQTLTWALTAAPAHGTVSFGQTTAASGGSGLAPTGAMTYQPAENYFGSDRFTVTVSDGAGGTAARTITVTVKQQASTPTADLASGTVVPDNSYVVLSTATAGATIYYTLDGTAPTTGSPAGTRVGISGAPGDIVTVKAMAAGPNLVSSDTATFTYIIETPAPTDLTASAGDGQAVLAWNAARGAVAYSVYQRTEAGSYGPAPVATVEGTSYTAAGLNNGTTYSFKIKAVLPNGGGGYSNEATATPMSGNTDLTGLSLSAGELSPAFSTGTRHYTVSVGSGVDSLTIAPSVADTVYGTVTVSVYDGAGLLVDGPHVLHGGLESPALPLAEGDNRIDLLVSAQDGSTMTYTLTVSRAAPATPTPAPSEEPTEPPTEKPTESSTPTPTPTPTPSPDSDGDQSGKASARPSPTPAASPGLSVTVNGQPKDQLVTVSTESVNGQTMLNATMDSAKLLAQLAASGSEPRIVIPAAGEKVDGISVVLAGDLVKAMGGRNAVLEVQSPSGSYTLPAARLDMDRLSAQLGAADRLSEITVRINVVKGDAAMAARAEKAGVNNGFSVVAAPVEFMATASYNGKSIDVDRFGSYVKREIPLPAEADPARITTAIVLDKDGTARHVPTFIQKRDGSYYAIVNSLTNSAYALIYHPVAFADVAGHWSESAVNDLASRMVVNGVDAAHYKPDAPVTRAEIAAIIVRALGLAPSSAASAFTDVGSGDWYAGALAAAQEYSLVKGEGNGTFGPSRNVTREEALTMLARAMTLAGLDVKSGNDIGDVLTPFADGGKVSSWAQESVAAALKLGLAQGSGKGLEPKRPITRAETAALVQRLLVKAQLIDTIQSR